MLKLEPDFTIFMYNLGAIKSFKRRIMSDENLVSRSIIEEGNANLGIEFGSTRIKGVLIDDAGRVLGIGVHDWENHLDNNIWTYPLDEVWAGIQDCYADLCKNVETEYTVKITKLKSFGISGMMHGYLPFDKDGKQLAEFRT